MTALGIFAKPPLPGLVKTRLMADIGAEAATGVYRYCLEHTLAVARDAGFGYRVFLAEPGDHECFSGEACSLQQGADLGERMLNALRSMLAMDNQGAMIIGSDCLDLQVRHLHDAAAALLENDLVLLPALDGGYALIGCKVASAELFTGLAWSSDRVLQQTLERAETLGLRSCLLEPVRDIDTLRDLEHYPQLLNLVSAG